MTGREFIRKTKALPICVVCSTLMMLSVSVLGLSANTVAPEPDIIFVVEQTVIQEPELVPIEINAPSYTEYDVPANSGFKTWMSYKTITSKSSPQYILQHTRAYTGDYGIRQVDGRYCVALGSYFTTEIGTIFDLVLENGTIIPCILADQKADIHTDVNNIMTLGSGCVSEFVVDRPALNKMAKRMGDISYCCEEWKSPVVKIRVY